MSNPLPSVCMDGIRIVKTTLSVCRSPFEKGYILDDMNAKGAFNRSSLQIVKVSDMVEPVGWYPGRLYYVVTKGLSVGIFHELLEVHRSVDPFPQFRLWVTCKTWKEAIKIWDVACQTENVSILRKDGGSATTSAAVRASTPHYSVRPPATQPRHHVSDSPDALTQPPTASPVSSLQVLTIKHPSAIVISDTDSGSSSDSSSSDSNDNYCEATLPKPIKKKSDGSDLTDNENGGSTPQQAYDGATDARAASCRRPTTPKLRMSLAPVSSGSGHTYPGTPSIAPTSQKSAQLLSSGSIQCVIKPKHFSKSRRV